MMNAADKAWRTRRVIHAQRFEKLHTLPGYDEIEVYKPSITKEEILAEVKRVAKLLKRTPKAEEFSKYASMCSGTARARFGSWNNVLRAAGLRLNLSIVDRDGCLAELKRIAVKLGHTPTRAEFDKHGAFSGDQILRKVGGWTKAVKILGLTPNIDYDITRQSAAAELKRVAKKLGHTPSMKEFDKHGAIKRCSVICKFKGSFVAALRYAGLEPNRQDGATSKEICADIRRVAKLLGRTPLLREYKNLGKFSEQLAYTRFGSWIKALKKAKVKIVNWKRLNHARSGIRSGEAYKVWAAKR